MRARAAALAAMLALAAPAVAEPALIAAPNEPGPDRVAGVSVLDALFPDGLPYPFAAVLDRLKAAAGPEHVTTALIPLGRSLQRYGAAPDYFASPRLLVAITGDHAAGPGDARLADRLFLGYQPAAEVVEAIAYNPGAGRFEFREAVGYADAGATLQPAPRQVCVGCHQGHGPIFARPLWSETNANPAVAAGLAALGPDYHGAPVRQSVDALAAFDAATDRAARIGLANRLWSEGCPDPGCRAALLVAGLRVGLGAAAPAAPPGFLERTRALWPEGMQIVAADLPNREPLAAGPAGLETDGALDPAMPRAPVVGWDPGADGFAIAAREIAAQFSPGDRAWVERAITSGAAASDTQALACDSRRVGDETRFACAAPQAEIRGFVAPGGTGRIDLLRLGVEPPLRVAVRAETVAGGTRLRTAGLAPRLADGRRVAEVVLGGGIVTIRLVDDLGPLLERLARSGSAALGPGPLDRRALLALVGAVAGGADG